MNHGHQRSVAGTKLHFIPLDIEDNVYSDSLLWQHSLDIAFTEKQALSSLNTKHSDSQGISKISNLFSDYIKIGNSLGKISTSVSQAGTFQ